MAIVYLTHTGTLYGRNECGYTDWMVVYIVSGVIVVLAGLFWLKVAMPAWHDFVQASTPHVPVPHPFDDLNDLLERRVAARRSGMVPADTPIKVREVA